MIFTKDNYASSEIQTEYGLFEISVIKHPHSGFGDVTVLRFGDGDVPLVRVHSECLTGDVFHSLMCDCYQQLSKSMEMIADSGFGLLIYLRQEGRGIGLFDKIRTYALQREGIDTLDANLVIGHKADERNYIAAADILKGFGKTSIRLITNNTDKIRQLEMYGIEIVERVPCVIQPNQYNKRYLRTKRDRMSHLLGTEV